MKHGGTIKIKITVLDFDNTVVLDPITGQGSEDVKARAWFDVFPDMDRQALAQALAEAQEMVKGGKGDRLDIAKHVLRTLGSPSSIDEEAKNRCDQFNRVVQEGILRIGVSLDVKNSLAGLKAKFPLYLNTGTPVEPMRIILGDLGIANVFKGIYGRPGTKAQNLRSIAEAERIDLKDLLYVGDMQADFEVTQEISCQFVGIYTARNTLWHTGNWPFPIIKSLAELPALIAA